MPSPLPPVVGLGPRTLSGVLETAAAMARWEGGKLLLREKGGGWIAGVRIMNSARRVGEGPTKEAACEVYVETAVPWPCADAERECQGTPCSWCGGGEWA